MFSTSISRLFSTSQSFNQLVSRSFTSAEVRVIIPSNFGTKICFFLNYILTFPQPPRTSNTDMMTFRIPIVFTNCSRGNEAEGIQGHYPYGPFSLFPRRYVVTFKRKYEYGTLTNDNKLYSSGRESLFSHRSLSFPNTSLLERHTFQPTNTELLPLAASAPAPWSSLAVLLHSKQLQIHMPLSLVTLPVLLQDSSSVSRGMVSLVSLGHSSLPSFSSAARTLTTSSMSNSSTLLLPAPVSLSLCFS